jgi:DNA-directed RNA polymerase specialized sigma24 family protein
VTREEFDTAIKEYAGFSIRELQDVRNEERPLSILEKIIIKRFKVPAQEARDIVVKGIAELFEKEKYKEFNGKSNVSTWLVGCLRNTVRQWRREQARHTAHTRNSRASPRKPS